MTIRVVVADDQGLVRAGFVRLLEAEPGIEVVGEAADGRAAVETCLRHQPDVALMDIRMPELDGISATRQVVSRLSTRVLVLTTYDLDEYVYRALEAGASGFLLKDSPPESLVNGIRVVAVGEALLAPRITSRLVSEFVALRGRHAAATGRLDRLTEREREVLHLVARGRSNAEIARELHLGESTVKSHVAAVLSKLEVRDRIHAVVFAYESGWVRPGS